MAFRHTINRTSDLITQMEDPAVTGQEFYNTVVGLPGFPWQHEFHADDKRDVRPDEILECLRIPPNIKKSALELLSQDAKKVFRALQDQAKIQAQTFSLAVGTLSDVSETVANLRTLGLEYEARGNDGNFLPEVVINRRILDSTARSCQSAKQALLFAAMAMAQTGYVMRSLLLDAAGVDRTTQRGPVSDAQYDEIEERLRQRRQDQSAENFDRVMRNLVSNRGNGGGRGGRRRGGRGGRGRNRNRGGGRQNNDGGPSRGSGGGSAHSGGGSGANPSAAGT